MSLDPLAILSSYFPNWFTAETKLNPYELMSVHLYPFGRCVQNGSEKEKRQINKKIHFFLKPFIIFQSKYVILRFSYELIFTLGNICTGKNDLYWLKRQKTSTETPLYFFFSSKMTTQFVIFLRNFDYSMKENNAKNKTSSCLSIRLHCFELFWTSMFVSTGSNYTHLANKHDLKLKLPNGFSCSPNFQFKHIKSKVACYVRAKPSYCI